MASTSYEQVIEPTRGWIIVDWKALLHYRDLLFLFVWRDFVAKYKQTILGPAWFIIQPLLTAMLFYVIFTKFTHVSTDNVPGMPFYLCGLLAWTYFAQSLPIIGTSLVTNSTLFSKVYFPRLVVPISVVISNLIAFVLQTVTFLAFYLYFKFVLHAPGMHPNLMIFALPLLVLQTALISLGYGLWLAVLTAKYRDLSYMVPFIVQVWMYATPIIYPLSSVPARYRIIVALNPLASVVEYFKVAFFSKGTVSPLYLEMSVGITLLIVLTGLTLFGRIERTFVDVI